MMRKDKDRLPEFETYIRARARQFARREADIEDFYQEGRIGAMVALRKDPDATKSYVKQAVEWSMLLYVNRGIYKNPEEMSANEMFGPMLWGDGFVDEA